MTRRLVALALVGVGALAYLAQATPTPTIAPSEAARWEGQSVAVQGVLRDRRLMDGVCRFDLVGDGHALPARLAGPCPLEGSFVVANGRLVRFGGTLSLLADDVAVRALDATLDVDLAALARQPDLWRDQVVSVQGSVDKGHLVQDGTRIALGRGDWPNSGVVTATILLVYDAKCACERLDRVAT